MVKRVINKLAGSQLRLNVLSGFLATGLGIVVSLVKYPMYLHFLDYEVYGVWLLLATLMGMAQIGMLGIGPSLTKLIAEEHGQHNKNAIEKYIATAMAILLLSGLATVSLILLFKSSVLDLLGFEGPFRVIGNTYLPYMCLLTLYVFVYQVVNATVAGLGRMDIANYSQIVVQLLSLMISVPMLMLGKGVLSLFIGNIFAYTIVLIGNVFYIVNYAGLRIFTVSNLSNEYLRKLVTFGMPIWSSSIAVMFSRPISKIFVGRFIGLSAVPVYEVASRVALQVQGLFNMGFKSLMPELSRLNSLKTEQSQIRADFIKLKAYKLIVFAGGGLCVILFVMAPVIFKLWLGTEYKPDIAIIFRILAVGTFINLFGFVEYYNLIALGRTGFFFIYNLVWPGINTLALIIFFMLLHSKSLAYVSVSDALGRVIGVVYLIISSKIIKNANARHSISQLQNNRSDCGLCAK